MCGKKRAIALLDALSLTTYDVETVYVALRCRINAYEVCSKGDVVLYIEGTRLDCGVVLLNMEMNGVAISLIRSFRLRHFFRSSASAEWDETDDIAPFATDDLVCTVKWKQLDGSKVRTLIPNSLHHKFE